MSRIAPTPRFWTHAHVMMWFNEIMIDLKMALHENRAPLVASDRLQKWDNLRSDLDCNDWDRMVRTGELGHNLHQHSVDVIDALVSDLRSVLKGDEPSSPIDEERIDALGALYPDLKQCKEDRIKY